MYCHSPYFLRGADTFINNKSGSGSGSSNSNSLAGVEEEHPVVVFHQQDAVDLSSSGFYGMKSSNVAFPSSLPYPNYGCCLNPSSKYMDGTGEEVGDAAEELLMAKKAAAVRTRQLDRWGDSAVAMHMPIPMPMPMPMPMPAATATATASQHTDTSTDLDTDNDPIQYHMVQNGAIVVDSIDQSKGKMDDPKTLRRLAQNREAARKSRLRKKAYVQQLESSRVRLAHLERELERACQQGFIVSGSPSEAANSVGTNGVVAFDIQYNRWLDEHQRLMNDTRSALDSNERDDHLRVHVDGVMSHYDNLYRLKSVGAKTDVFHMLSGMWKTPAERCFMWLGGFRSSELLKIVVSHLDPLTEQQLMGICNLQQSSQQAEDALSQGMEALQQSLVETLSATCMGPGPAASEMVGDYMGQMAIAMGKLGTLENFVHQADLLRQQTLQQMHRILTTRQAARALLVIHDYTTRLKALSSLWLARPRNCT